MIEIQVAFFGGFSPVDVGVTVEIEFTSAIGNIILLP